MDSLLLSTTNTTVLKSLTQKSLIPSQSSFSNGDSSILKLPGNNKVRSSNRSLVVAAASLSEPARRRKANAVVDGSIASVADVPVVSWEDLQYPQGMVGAIPHPVNVDKEKQMEYLTGILSSKVYDVAIESPLQLARKLSTELGVNLWLKRDDSQSVSS